MYARWTLVLTACALVAGVGCAQGAGDDENNGGGDPDAGGGGAKTGGTGAKTGGVGGVGPATGGVGVPTGGTGGGMDAGTDASDDASLDGASADGATDAGVDTGVDTGVDAGTDSGMMMSTGTATFGGAYSMEKSDCPPPLDCHTGNPLIAGGTTCGCPAAFPTAIGAFNHLDDRGGAGMPCAGGNPPYGWASSFVCYAGAFDVTKTDFGGAYHKAENGTCYAGNPMNGNACSCPTGSTAIELIADHGCYGNSKIGLCWNGTAPRTSFGGAYLASDNASYGTSGCVVANPATGTCSCPVDCDNISIRSIYGPGDEGACSNSGAFGAHLNICRKL